MKLAILTPVWNDWAAAETLLSRLDWIFKSHPEIKTSVYFIDDGSNRFPRYQKSPLRALERVEILALKHNYGDQQAIAAGISHLASLNRATDFVVTMDCNGEDKPEDILLLIEQVKNHPRSVIVAQRASRSEGRDFRFGYWLFQTLFAIATGKSLRFGNFMLIPMACAQQLAAAPFTNQHIGASVLRLNLPLYELPLKRGHRFNGISQTNLSTFFQHALNAIVVFKETVILRTRISLLLLGALFLAITIATGNLWAVGGLILAGFSEGALRLKDYGHQSRGTQTSLIRERVVLFAHAEPMRPKIRSREPDLHI